MMQQKLEGTLWKWTNYWNGWQPRWFVLDKGFLSYYKSEDEASMGCKGSINIAAAIVKGHPSDPYRLDVVVPGEQHFYLRAGSPHERQNWLVALGSVKSSVNSEKATKVLDEASRLRKKHCEVRLYCDLLVQQVHSIRSLVVETGIPDVNKLDENTALLTETCDTFIHSVEELMKMVNPNSHVAPPIVYPFPTIPNGQESPMPLVHSPTNRNAKDVAAHCSQQFDDTFTKVTSVESNCGSIPCSTVMDASSALQSTTTKSMDADLPTFFSEMEANFADLSLDDDGSVPTVAFLESAVSLTKIFDVISSTAFAPVKMDLNGNIRKTADIPRLYRRNLSTGSYILALLLQKLYQKYESDPASYPTLQSIVQSEIDKGTTSVANSATDALLWLKRGVNFVREFLNCFNEGEPNLTSCANKAYAKTLKLHHNWVVRGIFTLAAKAAPYREDFIKTLAVRQEDVGTDRFQKKLRSDTTSYIAGIDRSLKSLDQFYSSNKLDEL